MFTSRCLTLAALFLVPITVIGQEVQPAPTTTRTQGQIRSQGQQDSGVNKFIANCLRNANNNEVALSKLAEQKASDQDVKAFAQQMVKDHSAFLAKLDRMHQETGTSGASGATSTRTEIRTQRPGASNQDANDNSGALNRRSGQDDASGQASGQRNPADREGQAGQNRSGREGTAQAGQQPARTDIRVDTTRGDVTVGAAGAGMSGHLDQIVRMDNEIAQRCLASAQRELNQKQGKEFDECYMFMAVAAHSQMVDKLSVFRNHASGELQQLIDEGLQTTQQHLQHAKQLAQRIDQGGAADTTTGVRRETSSSRSGTTPTRDAPGTNRNTNNGTERRKSDSDTGTGQRASERQPNN